MIAAHCYIIDMDHGTSADKKISEQDNSVSPVVIGKDCWLGANVTVLKGSVIEDGAVIGAKSLVKGVVKENTINVGIPCKQIKEREYNIKGIVLVGSSGIMTLFLQHLYEHIFELFNMLI